MSQHGHSSGNYKATAKSKLTTKSFLLKGGGGCWGVVTRLTAVSSKRAEGQRSDTMTISVAPGNSKYLGNADYSHARASRQTFSLS